nr:uncharacterized protein LOC109120449 [Solanum lycopersicum]
MTDGEVRAALFQMTQTIMSQANRKVVPRENPHASTMASRLRDFTRMNPPMDYMSHFVKGVSEELEEECCAAMLHENMDLSRLMVHAQRVEESCLRRRNREAKRAKSFLCCYGCGKGGHMVKDCPNVISQVKGNGQSQPSGPSSVAQKRNCFYALKARGEQESSPDIVTGMLQVFSLNVYALLDPGATLSFVKTLVYRKFDVLSDNLIEPFWLVPQWANL